LRKRCALFAKRQSKGISAFAAERQQAPFPVRAQTRTHSQINTHYDTNGTRKQAERINGLHTCIRIPILAANRGPSPSVELQKFLKI
jgi:hypothetical protein